MRAGPSSRCRRPGCRPRKLDKIMRQKDPELLKAVQHLATGETEKGYRSAFRTGPQSLEIPNAQDRIAAIALGLRRQTREHTSSSPRTTGAASRSMRPCAPSYWKTGGPWRKTDANAPHAHASLRHDRSRSDMGCSQYKRWRRSPVHQRQQSRGDRARTAFATVQSVDATMQTPLTVSTWTTVQASTYDPRRLKRCKCLPRGRPGSSPPETASSSPQPKKNLGVANRDLGTVISLEDGQIDLANGRQIRPHGYIRPRPSSASSTTATP